MKLEALFKTDLKGSLNSFFVIIAYVAPNATHHRIIERETERGRERQTDRSLGRHVVLLFAAYSLP